MAVLEAFDLHRFFHTRESETLALRGVSLQLNEGELVALIAANRPCLPACQASMCRTEGMSNCSGSV